MNDYYWFKHDANARHDPKIMKIRREKGAVAKAVYWDLIEMLRCAGGKMSILEAIDEVVDENHLDDKSIPEYVIFESGLFEIEGEYFFSKSLLNHIPTKKNVASGEKHWKWKGGITPENKRIRDSCDYSLWRLAVFQRDNYTCQICEKRGGKLEAHHIKSFARYPELRLDLNNGITLCYGCHKKWHKEHGR